MTSKTEKLLILLVVAAMAVYFWLGQPRLMDDGIQYESFAESLAHGRLDFKSYYGLQGLSILAAPVFLITKNHISIILTSMILVLASIPLVYLLGRDFWKSQKAGLYAVILFLLTAFPYVTLMRGFQEAALFFFSILTIYLSIKQSHWTPLVWAFGSIVKPFNLFLFPLFIGQFWNKKKSFYLVLGLALGMAYLGANYYQTGRFINNAVLTSYSGNFNAGINPPLLDNFTISFKNFARIGANLLVVSRKIMISPIVMIVGLLGLLEIYKEKESRKFLYSVLLLVVFLGLLLYSFPKYLLPATAIGSLFAIPYLMRFKWLTLAVLADSMNVFLPIYNHHGHAFWNKSIFYLPIIYAALLYVFLIYFYEKRRV